jgi:Ser/Thr protein kinase RdoA (MazF antagonist)
MNEEGGTMTGIAPILKSFIDPKYLATCIAREYGLQEVQCQLIQATMRDMYEVSSSPEGMRFIAALYRWQPNNEKSIRAEMQLLEHIYASGIATAKPVKRSDGDFLVSITLPEGKRFLVLFEYIAGTRFPRQPNKLWIGAYGEAVARLHLVLDGIIDPLERPEWKQHLLLEKSGTQFADIPGMSAWVDELKRSRDILARKLETLTADAPVFGLIHGDVIPSNGIIDEDENLFLIDFDLCGYGWRMYDVATFVNEAAFWGMGEDAEKAFLEGYKRHRLITDEEKATISILGAARNIWVLGNAASHVNTWGSHIYLSNRVIEGELNILRRNLAAISP